MANDYSPRKTDERKERITFLIVCEGQKTERIYFGKYRERNSGLIIFTPNTTVTDPINLMKFTLNQIKKYDLDFEHGDQAWCVFDADKNTNDNIDQARLLAEKNNIKCCMSNPCFELWYLLHYCYFDQKASNLDLIKTLEKYIQNYDKTKDYFNLLFEKRNIAIDNAKKLIRKHQSEGTKLLSVKSSPSTQVVSLVEEILKLLEQNKK